MKKYTYIEIIWALAIISVFSSPLFWLWTNDAWLAGRIAISGFWILLILFVLKKLSGK